MGARLVARAQGECSRGLRSGKLAAPSFAAGDLALTDSRPVLHICLTCRPAGLAPDAPNDPAAGSRLHEAVLGRLRSRGLGCAVRVNPVSCMANCEQGCSAALSQPGKWSYVAGYLGAELADDLIDYALTYAASRTGAVMPSKRAPSLRDAIVARIPAFPDDVPEPRETA